MKKSLLFIFTLLISTIGHSQESEIKNKSKDNSSNYHEIIANKRNKLAKKTGGKTLSEKKAIKQFERWAYLWKDRVYSDGSFPSEILGYKNAGILDENGMIIEHSAKKNEVNESSWVNIGAKKVPDPNGYSNYPQMGRLNCLLRFPHTTDINKDVLFVGAPAGGIWKSIDGGSTWIPVLDNVSGIGITDIKSASTSYDENTVIYVSTGDWDGKHVNSIGVLKSTDGGNTFNSTSLSAELNQQAVTSNLIVLSDNVIIVGTSYHIYKTTDGGDNWSSTLSDGYNNKYGRFTISDNIISCTTKWGGIYKSTDFGETWQVVKAEGNSINYNALYIENGLLAAIDISGQISITNLKEDEPNWLEVGNKVPTYEPQGGYNQTLIIEGDLAISGGMNGFHSIDNGETWYQSLNGYWDDNTSDGNYIHSDHHSMGKLDNDESTYKYWSCNDGGLSYIEYSSINDLKPTITYKSEECIVTQLYSVAITPNSGAGNMLQGNQDNDGFSKEMHKGSMQWIAAAAGDGTATAIDYNNPGLRYLGGTNGSLRIAQNGFSENYQGNAVISIPGGSFIWPLEMNTQDPHILYAGGDDVYLVNITKEVYLTPLNSDAGTVSFINTHDNTIMAIGSNGVKKSIDGGYNWSNIVQPSENTSAKINSIDFNATNSNTVYATSKSYIDGDKVFKSFDGGATWTNISSNLPNILMKEILVVQNSTKEILYVATELGVYITEGDGQWNRLGGSTLPNVIVNDIDINYTENVLVAATYGRGLWQIDLSESLSNNDSSVDYGISVYPNPSTNDYVNISISNLDKKYKYNYIIYNVVGSIVLKGKLISEKNKIDLESISKGNYILQIRNNNISISTEKIIKQ